ncbi:dicarboxylate/amino acid:cation symporter [Planctomycetota bacterium]
MFKIPFIHKDRIQLVAIIVGITLAVLIGVYAPDIGKKVKFLGDIFLNMLKMMIVPLIVTSMIAGITRLGDVRKIGKLGSRTIFYYMATTAIAVIVGIILVSVVKPGVGIPHEGLKIPDKIVGKEHFSFIDVLLGFFPKNIFQAAAETKVLPLIIFSLLFGGILSTMGERARGAIEFFNVCNDVIMKIVHLIMWYAPVGIFGLVAGKLAAEGSLAKLIAPIAKYVGTVIGGLSIHAFILLPLLLLIFTRRNPLKYFTNTAKALLTAFSTASSSATLPVSMDCAEKKNKISKETSGFVLPLGATVNMDGTALYEAVAAIFIAQAYGMDLEFTHQVLIFLTATLAAIGAAGIPEAGLVTMVIVLQAVNIPLEGMSIILAIDWFLDRCRTTVNVWGDSIGCAIIEPKSS